MAPIASNLTRVLITGFGPFDDILNNPSWSIASRLPNTLSNNIELVIHPSYVPVAWHPTFNLIGELVSNHQPDISLHMGVAAGRSFFAIEQSSERSWFHYSSDVDGRYWTAEESQEYWGDMPERLETDVNLASVLQEWQQRTNDIKWPPELSQFTDQEGRSLSNQTIELKLIEDTMRAQDVRWTDSVGSYLCGFIYYASPAENAKKGKNKQRDVAFMHMPYLDTDELLQVGVDVAIELIQSLVLTWRKQNGDP